MAITSNNKSVVDNSQIYVHTKPFLEPFSRFWRSPYAAFIAPATIITTLFLPGFPLAIGGLAGAILLANLTSKKSMPVRMPKSSGDKVDPGQPVPGKEHMLGPASAITCLGVDRETQLQVWEDSDNERRHFCILATTGAGKTFGLRFYMLMALVQTTGVIAIDGKGDIELPLETVNLLRRFLREDDLRILNFKQGNKNVYAENGIPRTNTFNPFAVGSSTYIAEVLKALLSGDDPKAGKGDMWEKRAAGMCEIIAKLATYKRDHSNFKIRPGTIADMLELRELCRIYVDPDVPERFKAPLTTYFKTLPDFVLEKVSNYAQGEEFGGKILEQAAYVTMQLQPALQVLSDLYGFIFDTDSPEIDLKDVAINDRFLLALLPAMEQSEGTLRNTGKIILAALKGMIAGELGSRFQGNVKEILSERACSDPAPFKTLLDECGYYAAIPGIEILPAQGRGLGFAFYFIGQVYTDLEKGGKETADIIWGNCNNKTIGKTESETTYNKIKDRLAETTVMIRESMEINTGEFASERVNTDKLSYVRRNRLEMTDLTCLREGQYYHITNDKLIAIQMGDPIIKTKVKETRYNRFVGLLPIPDETQIALKRDFTTVIKRFKANLAGGKNKPVLLDKLVTLRDIVDATTDNRYKTDGTAIDNLALYQKIIYDHSMSDAEELTSHSNESIKNILGAKGRRKKALPNEQQSSDEILSATEPDEFENEQEDESRTIDDIPVEDWSAIASSTGDQGAYRSFDYANKATDYASLERQRMVDLDGDGDGDDDDDDDDDDDAYSDDESLTYSSEIMGEIKHFKMLLNTGVINQEAYESEIAALDEEMAAIRAQDDSEGNGDSGSDEWNIDDALTEQYEYVSMSEIEITQETTNKPGRTEQDQPALDYPSSSALEFQKRTTKTTMANLLAKIEDTFQVDI